MVATGKAVKEFNGYITLNETGRFLWDKLEKDTDENALVSALLEEYEVDGATAEKDVKAFLEVLRKNNILEK